MLNQIKRSVVLLFALPVAAYAAPVTIVTHAAGTATVNANVLRGLGATDVPATGEQLPYTLTITSKIDWTQPLPAKDEQVNTGGSHVIDLRVGDFTYHSTAANSNYLRSGRGSYYDTFYQSVGVITSERGFFEDTEFTPEFYVLRGTLGDGGALSPVHAEGGLQDGVTYGRLTVTYSTPWWDGGSNIQPMEGSIESYSVDITGDAGPVTSPVPEPAAFGMLAAGLLTIGLRRRYGRTQG